MNPVRGAPLELRSGGVGYTAVAQAVWRVRQQLECDPARRRRIDAGIAELSTMKM
jgi:hypothetical protein